MMTSDNEQQTDSGWSIKKAAIKEAGEGATLEEVAVEAGIIADRRLARIGGQRRALAVNEAIYQRKLNELEAWIAMLRIKQQQAELQMTGELATYWYDFPPAGRERHISLPSGKLLMRKERPTTLKDEEVARVWIRDDFDARQQYLRSVEPTVDWKTLTADIDFAEDGRAIHKPTGEVMEVTLEFDDGHTETRLVKERIQPPVPETMTIETREENHERDSLQVD